MSILAGVKTVAERARQQDEELRRVVFVKGNYIIVNASYPYQVPVDECRTAEGLLNWVYHLTEKSWMNTEILRRFMEVASGQTGVKLY